MSVFSEGEQRYLASQRLGRLATTNAAGQPHVMPVTFRYNPGLDTIDIGGMRMGATKKYRDVQQNGKVAFVVDDVLPPWEPRCLEIRGRGEAIAQAPRLQPNFSPELIRIFPRRIVAFGIDVDPDAKGFHAHARSVSAAPPG